MTTCARRDTQNRERGAIRALYSTAFHRSYRSTLQVFRAQVCRLNGFDARRSTSLTRALGWLSIIIERSAYLQAGSPEQLGASFFFPNSDDAQAEIQEGAIEQLAKAWLVKGVKIAVERTGFLVGVTDQLERLSGVEFELLRGRTPH